MTDTKKTRYRVDRNGFDATIMIGHKGTWVVCSGPLTPVENAYIERYCK